MKTKKILVFVSLIFLLGAVIFPQNIAKGAESGSDIVIDGYFDDWEGFPEQEITYGNNNKESNHGGNIYSDGDYLYVHVAMDEDYGSYMQTHSFYLTVNGTRYNLMIGAVDDNGQLDYGNTYNVYRPEGIHQQFKVYILAQGQNPYVNETESEVALCIYDASHQSGTKGDEIEFKVSMKDICRIYNIEEDAIQTISIGNPNIGGEMLIMSGTSSGPYVAAGLGFVVAAASLVLVLRANKKRKMMAS